MAFYEIGGVCVEMSEAQAERWNAGSITESDLDRVRVAVPEPSNQVRWISLRRATTDLEPQTAAMLENATANCQQN